MIFEIEIPTIRRFSWLWFKYYWYRWIKRKLVLGFYDGSPIFEEVNNG